MLLEQFLFIDTQVYKKKGGFSLPLPPIVKNYSILLANQNIFLKNYLIVHVKIEIIKKEAIEASKY